MYIAQPHPDPEISGRDASAGCGSENSNDRTTNNIPVSIHRELDAIPAERCVQFNTTQSFKAIAELCMQLVPEDDTMWHTIGGVYLENHQIMQAKDGYTKVLELKP